MTVYKLTCSLYKNYSLSDSLDDTLAMAKKLMSNAPSKAAFVIVVQEISQEEFDSLPAFEGYKVEDFTNGSD